MIRLLSSSPNHKHYILPHGCQNVARLLERAVRQRRVHWNYLVLFRDVNGIGVQLAHDPSLGKTTYVNPLERV